jgi:uncharacterized protein YutE (UPF0331/DUF86 family)
LKYNKEKIIKIKSEIQASISLLEDLKKISLDDFSKDKHKISSAKYNFIICIEGMIDLGNHLISQNNLGTPADYADSFRILSNEGIVTESLLSELIKAARFRNRLVHIYWEVDENELYNILQTGLNDIKLFLKLFFEFIGLKNNNI